MKSKWLIGALLGGALLLLIWSFLTPRESRGQPGSVYSTDRSGMSALYKWTQEIGYKPRTMEYERWEFKPEDQAMIMALPTQFEIDDTEILLDWVETSGATLILIDSKDNPIYSELNLHIESVFISQFDIPTAKRTPLREPLANPEVRDVLLSTQTEPFQTARSDGAVLLGEEDKPYVLAYTYGAGQIYVISDQYLIANVGLKFDENARLALNLLSRVPAGSPILFDEIHHGKRLIENAQQQVNLPLVASLLYIALVIAFWGMWNGRRFGSLIPSTNTGLRRSSAEYVQSMAGLFQRARQGSYVLNHYKTRFKRRLAKPYGFNPKLDDANFVIEFARHRDIDTPTLRALLDQLGAANPSAAYLLQIVAAADEFAQKLENGR